MVRVENVHKSFNSIHVLRGIDLDVHEGEIISIVGASGAGKSTLLHLIGTLDTPDQGRILIKGTHLQSLKEKQLSTFRNTAIGFVFQFHHLLPEFTALENVAIPALIAQKTKKESEYRAAEILERLGLADRKSHKPSALSGGEQQRVAIARALINKPSVILADEPSGNLDTQSAYELHSLFLQLRKDLGQTFIIVTHNPELADIADRKIRIKDGVIEI